MLQLRQHLFALVVADEVVLIIWLHVVDQFAVAELLAFVVVAGGDGGGGAAVTPDEVVVPVLAAV